MRSALVGPYLLLALAAAVLAGCGSSSSPSPTPAGTAGIGTSANAVHVLIVKSGALYAFRPASITIHAGTTVVWTNQTQATQSVSADGGAFDSAGINPGGSYQRNFLHAGTYHYSSLFHTYVTGVVVVK